MYGTIIIIYHIHNKRPLSPMSMPRYKYYLLRLWRGFGSDREACFNRRCVVVLKVRNTRVKLYSVLDSLRKQHYGTGIALKSKITARWSVAWSQRIVFDL